jgi:hypothetical protein
MEAAFGGFGTYDHILCGSTGDAKSMATELLPIHTRPLMREVMFHQSYEPREERCGLVEKRNGVRNEFIIDRSTLWTTGIGFTSPTPMSAD